MYSIRPHSSENIELDLPTSMYSVQPVIQPNKQSTNESSLKNIEDRQDTLLDKIDNLFNQLLLYQQTLASPPVPIREELVIHLSAKQPSTNILNLIEQFRQQLSIRIFRHSSLHDPSFKPPIQASPSSSSTNRALSIIWADSDELPYMLHGHMKLNDEQAIVNLLSDQITNNN